LDGYAFRHADLSDCGHGGTRLDVVGTSAAGHPYTSAIRPGEAVRIFTGAVMPYGSDTVAAQEETEVAGRSVMIPGGLRPGENRRVAGEDIAWGSVTLSAGERLGPAAIGLLASLGLATVVTRRPLRVAVFSTGDELRDGGDALRPGAIYDSNRPVLLAMLAGLGVVATDLGILPDDRETIRARLGDAARGHDAVICSAGMSVGDEDHVKAAVVGLGGLDFWSVAIKPGRPVAVGHIADTPFFGLPGNPVAMVVTFAMIVRPALLRLAGATPREPRRFPVTADFTMRHGPGKREFLRCTLHDDGGRLLARRFARNGAGILSSITGSEGLLELAETIVEIAPGMTFPFIPFSALGL
jgi:molybdopterin molybdotransferase